MPCFTGTVKLRLAVSQDATEEGRQCQLRHYDCPRDEEGAVNYLAATPTAASFLLTKASPV